MSRRPTKPVVVVTGAGAGVGRAVARAFGARGCDVGLVGRESDRLAAAAAEVEDAGGRAVTAVADVAVLADLERAAMAVELEMGPIDVWVNNAMVSVLSPFLEMSDEEFRRVTDVTYLGYVNGTRAALPAMIARDTGVIVQVGSALAYRAIPYQSAYCGAKHAVRGFTDAVRCELMARGSDVEITMVQLPALNTPQFEWVRTRLPRRPRPVRPVYQPELAARAVVYAASHPRRERWVGASTVGTIVASMTAPDVLDRYLARFGGQGQQSAERHDRQRMDNLFDTVPGAYGAHGRFDAEAHARSAAWWTTEHRRGLAALSAAGVVVAAGVAGARRARRDG